MTIMSDKALLQKQFPQEPQRGGFIAPALNQRVHHFDGPPHIYPLSGNRDNDLVEMPLIIRPRSCSTQISLQSRVQIFKTHRRIDSLLTSIPRSARISSASR